MTHVDTSAATAAAAAIQQQCEEEESMPLYDPNDLQEDWEFKILRSSCHAFKKPDKLQEILREEGRAGWVMVEKFDNGRIRFKRPASAKRDDRTLEFDPYRSYVGVTPDKMGLMIASLVMGVVLLVGFVVAFLLTSS